MPQNSTIPLPQPSPKKKISGLPDTSDAYSYDIHMNTAKGLTGMGDIRMATAKGNLAYDDIRMETARGGTTMKAGGFQIWERELLESPEIRRKATVAQLCTFQISCPSQKMALTTTLNRPRFP